MKLFYLIHALIVLEVVLAVIFIVKLQELMSKIQELTKEIRFNSRVTSQKIKKYHKLIENFNKEYQKKVVNNLDFSKRLILTLSIHCGKFFLPKNSILSRILNYKATIIGFLVSLLFFRKKNAQKPLKSAII